VICIGSGPVIYWCVIIFGFFGRMSPGCEFSGKVLLRIGVEGSEFEFDESLDGLGFMDDL